MKERARYNYTITKNGEQVAGATVRADSMAEAVFYMMKDNNLKRVKTGEGFNTEGSPFITYEMRQNGEPVTAEISKKGA